MYLFTELEFACIVGAIPFLSIEIFVRREIFRAFLSPCVLPVVPPYLAYMGGISVSEMAGDAAALRRVARSALFFVLGLSTIFLVSRLHGIRVWGRSSCRTRIGSRPQPALS